jgi:hypothetical protein
MEDRLKEANSIATRYLERNKEGDDRQEDAERITEAGQIMHFLYSTISLHNPLAVSCQTEGLGRGGTCEGSTWAQAYEALSRHGTHFAMRRCI